MKMPLLLLIALASVAFGNEAGTTDYIFRVRDQKDLAGMAHLKKLAIHEVCIGYFEFPDPDGDIIPSNHAYLTGVAGRWGEPVVFDRFMALSGYGELIISTDIHGDTPYVFVIHTRGVNNLALRAYRVEEYDIVHIPLEVESSNMDSIVVDGNRIIIKTHDFTEYGADITDFEYLFDGTTAKHISSTTKQVFSPTKP